LDTREDTLDAKKYDELYTSHVESAENWSLLTLTIKERTELVHDAESAALRMQLRIREKEGRNEHCTVKPCDLMQYLVRLVTPNGWTVLDPFNWSGSTWKAVMYENKDRNKNYKYIWIELTEEYLPIAKARIEYVINKGIEKEKSDPKQEEQTKQRKESALF
jgi:DNA modification methylase